VKAKERQIERETGEEGVGHDNTRGSAIYDACGIHKMSKHIIHLGKRDLYADKRDVYTRKRLCRMLAVFKTCQKRCIKTKQDLYAHKRDLCAHKRDLCAHKRNLRAHKRDLTKKTYVLTKVDADIRNEDEEEIAHDACGIQNLLKERYQDQKRPMC